MERILKKFILDHLALNNYLTDDQYGFRPSRSTQTQLLCCAHEWSRSLDQKIPIDVVYLDISKAFDSVSHPKLLEKLGAAGINGPFLAWIKCFLGDRNQRVRVGSAFSANVNVVSGVPQGSVLGPILFLVYINDLVDILQNAGIKLFADDGKVSMACKREIQHSALVEDLRRIFEWTDLCQLRLALEKCLVLHLGKNNPKIDLSVNGIAIPAVSETKDLGVFISSDLKFSLHCSKISSKALQKVHLIFRAFQSRDRHFLLSLYKSIVRSTLEFNSSVWSPYLLKDIKTVEKVQRKFTKKIPGMRDLSYMDRLKILGLETLESRRLKADLVQAFKVLRGIDDLPRQNNPFILVNHGRNTRGHAYKLEPPKCNTDPCKNSFFNRVVSPWNSLADNVVSCPSLAAFKHHLRSLDLGHFLKFRV